MTRTEATRKLIRGMLARSPDGYRDRASRYRHDVAAYCRDVLRREPTPGQVAIWDAVLKPPYRVLVPSANAQGKTFAGACFASWFYDTFDPSTCLITAPTYVQVRDLMFKELRTLRPPHGFLPRDTRLESSWNHFVHGFTAATADGFQGRHADAMSLIFDEATGVHRDFADRGKTMWKAHDGHYWLCFYNPNDPSTWVYEAEESGQWATVRLSALDHPNVIAQLRGEPPPVSGACVLEQVVARLLSECETVADGDADSATDFIFPATSSPLCAFSELRSPRWWRPATQAFEAQVLGRWPLLPAGSLFTPAMVARCSALGLLILPEWEVVIGCDVARFGDDRTAFAVRKGPVLLHAETASKRDTSWIADRLVRMAHEWTPSVEAAREVRVVIDATGGYGGGVADQLADRLPVIELAMSAKSPDPAIFLMRSYLWFRLAQLAAAGLLDLSRLPPGPLQELRGDLIAPKYRHGDGPKRVEPKDQIKARLKRSPDLGDAVALCYYG